MFIFALAVLASFVAGMTRSITELESLSADRGLILIVAFAALIVVASQTIVSYERLDTLLRRAVVLGSVVAAIGIAEFYTGINITNYIRIPGLSPAVNVNSLLDRNGFNRPSSTATQPIEFGVVMAMLLPFALQQAFDPANRPVPQVGAGRPAVLRHPDVAVPVGHRRPGDRAAVDHSHLADAAP